MVNKRGSIDTEGILIFILIAFIVAGSFFSDENGEVSGFLAKNTPACSDNVDNDGDGLVDWDGNNPARGDANDPGCAAPNDGTETGNSVDSPCDDLEDNDGDGEMDYKADGSGDQQCVNPSDMSEYKAGLQY